LEAATTTIGRSLNTKNGSALKFVQNNTDRNVEVYVNDELFLQSLKGFGLNAGTTRVVMIGTRVAQTSMEGPVEGFKVWLNFKTKYSAIMYDERLAQAGVSRVQFTPFKEDEK
jgi:hypothetical protein